MNHARSQVQTTPTQHANVIEEILGNTESADARERRWNVLKEQTDAAFASRMLPKYIDSIHAARAIAMLGEELGLRPMTAFRVIYFFDGKFALAAELLHALAQRTYPGFRIDFLQSNDHGCYLECWHEGMDKPAKFFFTSEQADNAGLMVKPNWQKYPAAMCRARATAAAVRACAPRAGLGFAAVEEIDSGIPFDDVATPTMAAAADAAAAAKVEKKGAAGLKDALTAAKANGNGLGLAPPPAPPPVKLKDRSAPPPGFEVGPVAGGASTPAATQETAQKPEETTAPKAPRKSPEESRQESDEAEAEIAKEIESLTSAADYTVWDEGVGAKWEKMTPAAKRRQTAKAFERKKELDAAAKAPREPGSEG